LCLSVRRDGRRRAPAPESPCSFTARPARFTAGMIRYRYNQQVTPPAPFIHVTIRRPADDGPLAILPITRRIREMRNSLNHTSPVGIIGPLLTRSCWTAKSTFQPIRGSDSLWETGLELVAA